MTKCAPTPTHYPFVDGLRGVAILWVILFHANPCSLSPNQGPLKDFLIRLIGAGNYGVDIFFVISGFLITQLLIPQDSKAINLKYFYAHRAFKILPSYYFLIACLFIFSIFSNPSYALWQNTIPYLTFTENIFPKEFGHLWSIAVEENFYLVYPLLAYLIFKLPLCPNPRHTLIKALLLILLSCVISKFFFTLTSPRWPFPFTPNFLTNLDALCFGCLIKLLEPTILSLSQPKKKALWLFSLAISLILWILLIGNWDTNSLFFRVKGIASGFLFLCLLLSPAFILKTLSNKILCRLGKMSYTLYLWHYPLLLSFPQGLKDNPLIFIPSYLTITFLTGWLASASLEQYFLKLRKRFLKHGIAP